MLCLMVWLLLLLFCFRSYASKISQFTTILPGLYQWLWFMEKVDSCTVHTGLLEWIRGDKKEGYAFIFLVHCPLVVGKCGGIGRMSVTPFFLPILEPQH